MKTYRIIVTREARDQLDRLHSYIAEAASTAIAANYVDGIFGQIETLEEFPERGAPRDDLRKGLRTLVWRRRVTIALSWRRPTA